MGFWDLFNDKKDQERENELIDDEREIVVNKKYDYSHNMDVYNNDKNSDESSMMVWRTDNSQIVNDVVRYFSSYDPYDDHIQQYCVYSGVDDKWIYPNMNNYHIKFSDASSPNSPEVLLKYTGERGSTNPNGAKILERNARIQLVELTYQEINELPDESKKYLLQNDYDKKVADILDEL